MSTTKNTTTISNNMKKHINTIKKALAPLSNNNYYSDDVIHTALKDCTMDYKETCNRLKMIHDVREISGKHSVDDVYVMLKECNFDPNEAAQRLIYLDSFHEVKKKNDRRKSTSSDDFEEYGRGRGRGNQWWGPRNGERGNFYPSRVYIDAGVGRNMNSRKEHVAVTNHTEKLPRQTLPVNSGKQNGHVSTSTAKINGTLAVSNGSHSPKLAPKVPSYSEAVSYQNTKYTCSVGTIKCEIVKRESSSRLNDSTSGSKKFSADQAGAGISSVKVASDVVVENQIPEPLLTNQSSTPGSKKFSADQSGSGTSHVKVASDVVVENQIPEPLLTTQNSTPGSKKSSAVQGGAGTSLVKVASDVVVENQIPEPLLTTQNSTSRSKKFSADQAGAGISAVVAEAASDVVAKNPILESLSTGQDGLHVVSSTQENQPAKATVSEKTTAPFIDTHSTSEKDSELKLSPPNLDVRLEKMTVSSKQLVIFPDHLQVPESYKNQFIFGSLNDSDDSGPLSVIESTHHNGDVVTDQNGDVVTDQNGDVVTDQNGDVTELSPSDQNVPTAAQEVEHEDHPPPDHSDHVLPAQENIASDSALKQEQTEQQMVPPIAGFQNLVFPTTRDYSYGFIPHPVSPHFVQLDVPELQSVNSQAACTLVPTSAAQPAMAGQTSIAMSPPQFPYYRQPYPAYISYNPYFHPMYFAPNAQLLNHGVFPQQPPPVNVHMQPAVKAPAPPSQSEQESNIDHIASQANDPNVQSTAQQGEGPQVRAHAAGRDVLPSLPPHYFYNFPQAQHMAFSPFPAGLYHSSQTMASQPTIQPPLMYQMQPTSGTIEPVILPPSYQQAEPALRDRETN